MRSHEPPSRARFDARPVSAAPAITLPKGGGAIRGMGEKFAANPVTGTGSMTVPLPLSPGRGGSTPQLALSYDSGNGNGPFGFGWIVALPSITRKTDKGLPLYRDGGAPGDEDVCILSGSEDLVPALVKGPSGWTPDELDEPAFAPGYRVRRYRPRVETNFARIERWTRKLDGDTCWRSISRDNVTTWYGRTRESRIFDPADPLRVFSWLICEEYDDRGNAMRYEYARENSDDVDTTALHERNRNDDLRRVNLYPKRVLYGNRTSRLDQPDLSQTKWMFELVFDYGEHDEADPTPQPTGRWLCRHDPFSSYRAGFEVRTYRLCQRVLMFHHFAGADGVGDNCLVRSLDLAYRESRGKADDRQRGNPLGAFLASITQNGFKRPPGGVGAYIKRSMPPVEFTYSLPEIDERVREIDPVSLENLPVGLDEVMYQWVDLDGEGVPGILGEHGGGWYYKRNLSPANEVFEDGLRRTVPEFGPLELIATKPSFTLSGGVARLVDLAGDGRLDLAVLDAPVQGFFERGDETIHEPTGRANRWTAYRPFSSCLTTPTRDPNVRLVDLDGDGHADVLETADDAMRWYPSLGEAGFGPAQSVATPVDEEKGPRLVFADASQSIYLADMTGDGLSDLVRVRARGGCDICYWPNLGHGRFGAKVAMDNAPRLDRPADFDPRRVRLADIDGSGCNDLIYLGADGVRIYFNETGNRFAAPHTLEQAPSVDDVGSITTVDLTGTGTACLVWSSPLPTRSRAPLRYIALMGDRKPHLLTTVINNLGAETRIDYAPSTKFYLQDRLSGRPWITRLAFPVHVVERVETRDRITRSRFVTRFVYHHGYFDGDEREFRGFAMVERFDTEAYDVIADAAVGTLADNEDAASHVPPALTRTWFHTGAFVDGGRLSRYFAETSGEYYREPGLDQDAAMAMLLDDDPTYPAGLSVEEQREACRALKGSILRQEIFGRDGSARESHPYMVSERSHGVRLVQPRMSNRHAAFAVHSKETIERHYEREPSDPRVAHTITLEVDPFGNVLKSAAIAYGRRVDEPAFTLPFDLDRQSTPLITYTETELTRAIDDDDDYRTPLPAETRTYELTGYTATGEDSRYAPSDLVADDPLQPGRVVHRFDIELEYEASPTGGAKERRLIEAVRTLYRPDDFGDSQNDTSVLLVVGDLQPLALAGETYKLAFTQGLIDSVYRRSLDGQPPAALVPTPGDVLAVDIGAGATADRGGYVDLDGDGRWWAPSGRTFLSPVDSDAPAIERAYARSHFFTARRFRDPFNQTTYVNYDDDDLLTTETVDAVGNRVTAGERSTAGVLVDNGNDYRVLRPRLICDANRNITEVAFDALGLVVGTATRGKPGEPVGDSLVGFDADLDETTVLEHISAPLTDPHAIIRDAGSRVIYDLFAYYRTRLLPDPQPPAAYTMTRETHARDLPPGEQSRLRHGFSYSNGFGREMQAKAIAEPGPLDSDGPDISPRWVGTGWTIFNNRGAPVRRYEPFFSATHAFDFKHIAGVSSTLFYDPLGRVVATLHPNHTYDKVLFSAWHQETWDVNDTCARTDPSTDPDVGPHFARLPSDEYQPTWYAMRTDAAHAAAATARWPDARDRAAERRAALISAKHADTSTTAHFDVLGRVFLTIARNKYERLDSGGVVVQFDEPYSSRVVLDIEGNPRGLRDAIVQNGDELGRAVMRYDYDMLGNQIHQSSMEAGERWTLLDVSGKPIRAWTSRGHDTRTEYDPLRRPLRIFVQGADRGRPAEEVLTERLVYGEQHPAAELRNLRGKVYSHLDQAGAAATEQVDFKGNPLLSSRRLTNGTRYRNAVDWRAVDADHAALPTDAAAPLDEAALSAALAPLLDADAYRSESTYDALNRVITTTTPHTPMMSPSVIRRAYNEAGLLERIDGNIRGELDSAGQLAWTEFVGSVAYNAKEQRTRVDYGNGATTFYDYDPDTFRLTRLHTARDAARFPDDLRSPPGWPGADIQDLHYTYDPVGNITGIRDDAQQTIFFRNQRVEPSNDYVYDAIYRLIEATGREHLGQAGATPTPSSAFDSFHTRLAHPSDGQAMGRYTERYHYDSAGNIELLHHLGDAGDFRRTYTYDQPSVLEPTKQNNRLGHTTVGGNNPLHEPYLHDAHGNMIRMPHLAAQANPLDANLHWDWEDQLAHADLPDRGTVYYVYDARGQRIRKIRETSQGTLDEHIYLGVLDVHCKRDATGAVVLERETIHIVDGNQRIALVEQRTRGVDDGAVRLTRYQLANHLGSVSLELDGDAAAVISYEEFTHYGSTSYQAARSQTDTPKRFRFTGVERDDDSGLCYHGARYYAPWLGRWTVADPAGIRDGPNLYAYCNDRPTVLVDPTGHEGESPQLWFGESKVFQINPVHTRTSRGTTKLQYKALKGIDHAFGPGTGMDYSHAKGHTFGVTPAGAAPPQIPEPSSANRGRNYEDKVAKWEAAAQGKFTRQNNVDPTVKPGTRFTQPPPTEATQIMAAYAEKIKPPASPSSGQPTPPSASPVVPKPAPAPPEQLSLKLDQGSGKPPPPQSSSTLGARLMSGAFAGVSALLAWRAVAKSTGTVDTVLNTVNAATQTAGGLLQAAGHAARILAPTEAIMAARVIGIGIKTSLIGMVVTGTINDIIHINDPLPPTQLFMGVLPYSEHMGRRIPNL